MNHHDELNLLFVQEYNPDNWIDCLCWMLTKTQWTDKYYSEARTATYVTSVDED